jgi:hypothetical protein
MRQSGLQLLPQDLLTRLHTSAWPGLILILVALGLLGAFHQVTCSIVKQSELRLQSISAYNKATWRCKLLRGQIARENCLSQLKVMPSEISAGLP